MKNAACISEDSLVPLFLLTFSVSHLTHIAIETRRYAYIDWVKPKKHLDGDRNKTNSMYLLPILKSILSIKEQLTQEARHQAGNRKKKYEITPYIVLEDTRLVI